MSCSQCRFHLWAQGGNNSFLLWQDLTVTSLSLVYKTHMVKWHENAYSPKNLSPFAFNIEGYWGRIKKKLKETKSQMFLSMSLHLWKCFAFVHGIEKLQSNCLLFLVSTIHDYLLLDLVLLNKKKKTMIWQILWIPCRRTIHFQRCKDIDKNIWLFISFNFFFVRSQ